MAPHINGIEKRACVPVETKLLLTLWTLGNLESFRDIGDRFRLQMGRPIF
jgi:hypothetical protein